MPARESDVTASMADEATSLGVSKPSGAGNNPSAPIIPKYLSAIQNDHAICASSARQAGLQGLQLLQALARPVACGLVLGVGYVLGRVLDLRRQGAGVEFVDGEVKTAA